MTDPLLISCLDLGELSDYTAHALIHTTPPRKSGTGALYTVVNLVRYRPSSYPALVRDVTRIHRQVELYDRSILALDATGVGRPVVEMFHTDQVGTGGEILRAVSSFCPVYPVSITAGQKARPDAGMLYVPKHELAMTAQVVLQQQRLKFDAGIPADVLTLARKEFAGFKIKYTAKGSTTYEAGRTGDHDDIVLSIAIGLWLAEKLRVYEPHRYHRALALAGSQNQRRTA